METEFLDPRCGPYSLDSFHARKSILAAVRCVLPEFKGTVLDVGCGQMPYKNLLLAAPSRVTNYIGLDLDGGPYRNSPDLTWDGIRLPLPDNAVDCALATEVLEHCPDPGNVLGEMIRVLKPGGWVLITVPFLWPLHDVPYDEYRYTPFSLARLMREAGYSEIQIRATGGWDASLAQMIGLWVRRRPMARISRRILQRLLTPVYCWLLWRDRPAALETPQMITGLWATGRKPCGSGTADVE